ncbi:hypothetical protein N752_00560 [Desulforamulus aquiferis]|nr:hypothetical protein N752_00560 [Desulforamulus aquiferis]
MIQFYNVSKVYDNGVKAVSDLTLTIKKGEFVFWWDQVVRVNQV